MLLRRDRTAGGIAGHTRDKGQALVEFALVLPVLTLFLFGIIQFGFLLGGQLGLDNAVRDAARAAAVNQGGSSATLGACTTTGATNGTNAQKAYQALLNKLPAEVPGFQASRLVTGCTVTAGYADTSARYCSYLNADGATYSIRVIVTATYRHPLFVPVVGAIVDRFDGSSDNALKLRATEEMRVENTLLSSSGGIAACP